MKPTETHPAVSVVSLVTNTGGDLPVQLSVYYVYDRMVPQDTVTVMVMVTSAFHCQLALVCILPTGVCGAGQGAAAPY